MIVSETYSIQDCDYWNATGLTYTSNSTADTTYSSGESYECSLNGNFEYSFRMTFKDKFRFYWVGKNDTIIGTKTDYGIGFNRSSNKINVTVRTTSTSNTQYGSTISEGQEINIKVIREGNSFNIYQDNTLLATKTITWWNDHNPHIWAWAIWGTGTVTVTNLKVKPLPSS